jgi:hypothetical protein
VRVLSYEPAERLLDVTLDADVVRGGRTKARKAAAAIPRAVGLEVTATVTPLTTPTFRPHPHGAHICHRVCADC